MNANSCQLGKLCSHTVTVKYHFGVMQTNIKLLYISENIYTYELNLVNLQVLFFN